MRDSEGRRVEYGHRVTWYDGPRLRTGYVYGFDHSAGSAQVVVESGAYHYSTETTTVDEVEWARTPVRVSSQVWFPILPGDKPN